MADTTALKNRIRAAIKANDNQEITGPVLQQTLLDIVDELSDRIVDEYALIGIAVPTTIPPSNLTEYSRVFYLAAQNGIYTNLGGIEVSNEIAVIEYNGTSWFKDTIVIIDDAPTAGSSNFISSGAVFDAFKNDGGAYDVSVHFPTGGVEGGNTYTLDGAIAMVPQNVRKGGMMIRFVHSSDNKYVQYRLMPDEWSTTVSDWQGVDDNPTAGSDNLVKSGGVASHLINIEDELKRQEGVFNREEDDTFYVTDKHGNVIAKIDSNGLKDVNTEKTKLVLERLINNDEKIRRAFDTTNNDGFYVCDINGNISFSINKKGDICHKTIRSGEQADEFYVTDEKGFIAFHIDNQGNVNYNGKSDSNTEKKDDGYTPADIVLNIMHGQSLSQGGFINSGENVSTILQFNTVDNYVMTHFTDEVLASEQSIAEYFGDSFIPSKTGIKTTPIGFANTMIMRLLNAENGINISFKEGSEPNYHFQMLGINPTYTVGGPSWTMCADPDLLYYKRLLKAIEYGKKIAEKHNLTFCVGSVCYMQGENSSDSAHSATTRKDFHDKLWVLFSNLDYDIKRITGQDNDVAYFTYQLASQVSLQYAAGHLDIPLAQLDIALETGDGQGYTLSSYPAQYLKPEAELIDRKFIHLGAIMNSLDYANNNDHVHCTNNSYATAGAEFGIQIKRAVYDKKIPQIIYPKSHKVIQRDNDWLLVLDMDVPVRPLVFDTEHKECQSQRANATNYGFSILSGETEIITSVYLRRGQEICISCSANPAGLSLTYAKDGWEVGGNLRDSQNIPFTINGFNNIIHNWCPTFEITI